MSSGEEVVSTPLRADNVISQKIANILSTSYADVSIRKALESLDQRVDKNTVETRRHLRSNTEAEVIKANGVILKDFSKIANHLRSLGDSIKDLNQKTQDMEKLVIDASRSTSQIVRESNELKVQDEKILGKQALLQAYENAFIISPEEIEVLTSAASPVDDQFFEGLERIKRVHEDCQALLATENSKSQAGGLEIMSSMSEYLDRAYDKLYYSVQHEFKHLSGQYVQLGRKIRRSLVTLAERPGLFESALNGLCENRQKSLSMEFVSALSTETPSSKPIDYYAYDPLRYIGDIMAWIHSAAVNERENLDALFQTDTMTSGLRQGLASEPWEQGKLEDIKGTVDSQIDKITGSLVRPLKVRVEQVISAETKVTTVYQVSNVLLFYHNTFLKHFKQESAIILALARLRETCMRQFRTCLEEKIRQVKETQLQSTTDLQPPEFLFEANSDLKAVLTSYESSMAYTAGGNEELRQIIEDMTEPYLECCRRISSDLGDSTAEVFLINCYDLVKINCLSLFSSLSEYKIQQLDTRIEELVGVLVDRQYAQFLKSSGIEEYKDRLNDEQNVAALSTKLDDFLPAATMESTPQLQRLSSPRIGSTITLRASQKFCDEFQRLETKISHLYPDEEARTQIFPRSLDEVKVLLAID